MFCPWANCLRQFQGLQCFHCQGDFTLKTKALLSLELSEIFNKDWHLNFNYIIVFFRWFEAKFVVCFPFPRPWGIFPLFTYVCTYVCMYITTAPFIYEILFITLCHYFYVKTTCKLRSRKNWHEKSRYKQNHEEKQKGLHNYITSCTCV